MAAREPGPRPSWRGPVGWAAARVLFQTSHGDQLLRLTYVLHPKHGDWKIVQAHHTVPSSNVEHGFMLTTSADEIVRSLSRSSIDLTENSAPDGTVTLMFTDIEDSTRLNAFLGDQRWLDVLRAHNEVVTKVTESAGGTVVKSQGDSFMLAFSSARTAVRCAIELQREINARFNDPGSPVRVRIGAHVGETVRESDDFFGQAVNYAARITSTVSGGEIVTSSLVHTVLGGTGEFTFAAPRRIERKRIDEPQLVYPVAWSP